MSRFGVMIASGSINLQRLDFVKIDAPFFRNMILPDGRLNKCKTD